jgi:hypothetical protein
MLFIKSFFFFFKYAFLPRARLVTEILSLRQQLSVAMRSNRRMKLTNQDRLLMVLISRIHPHWRSFLAIVRPATVVAWHRRLFKLYWRLKSKPGRQEISAEIKSKIRQLAKENPLWTADRIRDTLLLLGYPHLSDNTVRKYMPIVSPRINPPGTWKTFLHNHCCESWGVDFFTVHTLTFKMLYCFVVIDHGRRKVMHFAVTASPTMQWIIQQRGIRGIRGHTPTFDFKACSTSFSNRLSCGGFGVILPPLTLRLVQHHSAIV